MTSDSFLRTKTTKQAKQKKKDKTKHTLSVNRCWESVIVSFDENVQERDCSVLFEFNGEFDIRETVSEVVQKLGCWCMSKNTKRQVKIILFSNMRFIVMFVTAVSVLFLFIVYFTQGLRRIASKGYKN